MEIVNDHNFSRILLFYFVVLRVAINLTIIAVQVQAATQAPWMTLRGPASQMLEQKALRVVGNEI